MEPQTGPQKQFPLQMKASAGAAPGVRKTEEGRELELDFFGGPSMIRTPVHLEIAWTRRILCTTIRELLQDAELLRQAL